MDIVFPMPVRDILIKIIITPFRKERIVPMKVNLSKTRKIVIITGIILFFAAMSVLLGYANTHYYSVPIFHLDQAKYNLAHTQSGESLYTSPFGPDVLVQDAGDNRKVIIDKETFSIAREKVLNGYEYKVGYPAGQTYQVTSQNDMFLAFDEQGELAVELSFEVNGTRMLSPGEERYFPSALVIAAYPQLHYTQGSFGMLILAVILLMFGWCTFRYEPFQRALFWASLRWVWFEDPEPSDFYFMMSKISGIIIMLGSIVVAFQSL